MQAEASAMLWVVAVHWRKPYRTERGKKCQFEAGCVDS